MTVMGNAKQKNPDALDEETSAFLATLADDEAWRNTYVLNDYNSIKFTYDRERIAHTPPAQLLRMTLHTVASDPRGAFEAFNAVTDLVWDVTGQNEGYENVRNSGDIEEARYGSAFRLNTIGKAASAVPIGTDERRSARLPVSKYRRSAIAAAAWRALGAVPRRGARVDACPSGADL